jgi:CHAT domain-containing protein/tetratricopeptide (TPR) repeat protein
VLRCVGALMIACANASLAVAQSSAGSADALSLTAQAASFAAKGQFAAAEPLQRQALENNRATLGENAVETAKSYAALARDLDGLGRYAEAAPLYGKALDILRARLGDSHPDTARVASDIAHNMMMQGRYAEAERTYRSALDASRAANGEKNAATGTLYHNLASDLDAEGRFAEAEALHRKALDILRATAGEQDVDTAAAYAGLADNLDRQDRYGDAEPLFRRAIEIARAKLGDSHPDTARFYGDLASNLVAQGRFAEADPLHRKVLAIFRTSLGETHPDTATAYTNLAINLDGQGRFDEAEPLFRKVVEIRSKSLGDTHPETMEADKDLAGNLSLQASFNREGEDLCAKVLAFDRATFGEDSPQTVTSYLYLANALKWRSPAEAESAAASALKAVTHLRARDSKTALSSAILPGEDVFARIDSVYLQIAAEADAAKPGQANAHVGMALLAAQDLVQSASSTAMVRAAARQAAGNGPLSVVIREEQDLSARVPKLDQQILTALGGSDPSQSDALRHELDRITARLGTLDAQIDRDFPAYRAMISPSPIALDRVQGSLAADEGLLLLVVDHQDIYSFAVTAKGSAWRRLAGGAEKVTGQIAHLRCQVDADACHGTSDPSEAVGDGEAHTRHFDLAVAYSLYSELVAPVEPGLAGVHRLYITTSGALADLPLGVLTTTPPAPDMHDDDPAVLAKASWLSDRYAITDLPAVSGLLLRKAAKPWSAGGGADERFDGYGDPSLNGDIVHCPRSVRAFSGAMANGQPVASVELLRNLCPLPHSADELRSLAMLMHAPPTTAHLGGDATETKLYHDPSLTKARIIAFSTHGALEGEGKAFGFSEPGLVLTPPQTPQPLDNGAIDDGVLTASEASRLSLSADWVILSACNTASAQGSSGADGLSALSRGFLYAGAHALLASHWRVADDSASALTTETLRIREAHPEMSRASALQMAMRTIRTGVRADGGAMPGYVASWAHPADWAPFTAIANYDQ